MRCVSFDKDIKDTISLSIEDNDYVVVSLCGDRKIRVYSIQKSELNIKFSSSFELQEGSDCLLENYKFKWFKPHLYCIPLVGMVVVCSLVNISSPLILNPVYQPDKPESGISEISGQSSDVKTSEKKKGVISIVKSSLWSIFSPKSELEDNSKTSGLISEATKEIELNQNFGFDDLFEIQRRMDNEGNYEIKSLVVVHMFEKKKIYQLLTYTIEHKNQSVIWRSFKPTSFENEIRDHICFFNPFNTCSTSLYSISKNNISHYTFDKSTFELQESANIPVLESNQVIHIHNTKSTLYVLTRRCLTTISIPFLNVTSTEIKVDAIELMLTETRIFLYDTCSFTPFDKQNIHIRTSNNSIIQAIS